MKKILGTSPVASISGYLLAGILAFQEIAKAGETRWYILVLAALIAVAGRLTKDGVFVGNDPVTSIIGYVQFIAVSALQALTDGIVDWKAFGLSLVVAILSRLTGDSKKKEPVFANDKNTDNAKV